MRVLIIGLNYAPESTSYTAELAEYLASRQHRVQVITAFPIVPNWKIWPKYQGKRFMREVINGVPILRSYIYVPKSPGRPVNRILFDTSFSLSAFAATFVTPGCDLVMAVLPPLQLGPLAFLVARFKRAPLFLHIQDIVPDIAVATGALRAESLPVRIAHLMERFSYRYAQGIGVISDGFAENLIGKGVPPSKIQVLSNWVDLEFIRPGERNNEFRAKQELSNGDFLVMYSGSIAAKQGLETLVEAAGVLREQRNIMFCVIGEGPNLDYLKERALQLHLSNIRFLPFQPRANLPVQLAAADALIITQRLAVKDVVLPGKLATYLASGRPLIASVNADSETARYICRAKAGLVVEPEHPEALAGAILRVYESACLAEEFGQNGRRFAEAHFDRTRALDRFATHLEHIAAA